MKTRIKFAALAALLSTGAVYAGDPPPSEQPPTTPSTSPSTAPSTEPSTAPSSDATPMNEEPQAATQLPEFSTLDVNGDGVVSQEEAKDQPGLAAIFSDVDANHDGKLDSREYAEARNRLEK